MVTGTLVRCLARETLSNRHELGAFWKWEPMASEMFTSLAFLQNIQYLLFTSGFAARGDLRGDVRDVMVFLKSGLGKKQR